MAGLVIVLIAAALLAYVRIAPSDPAVWHQPFDQKGPGDYPIKRNGFEAVRVAGPQALAELDAVIGATARTRRLAGSVEEGMITYVTRSALIGFPDYTTLWTGDGTVAVAGRARFGIDDLGVNKARILGWLAQVDGLSGP